MAASEIRSLLADQCDGEEEQHIDAEVQDQSEVNPEKRLSSFPLFRRVLMIGMTVAVAVGIYTVASNSTWQHFAPGVMKSIVGLEEEQVVDVLFDNTTIPAEGTTFCVYHALPTDDVYQAVDFKWTESHQNIGVVMMFSISDHAVENLKGEGYNIKDTGSSVFDCSDFKPLTIAQWSGGYLLMQKAPQPTDIPAPIPSDWGMLVGKGTARKHVLLRWEYKECPGGVDCQDPGTGFHIRLLRGTPRPVNFGEAKFAIAQTMPPSAAITVPAGEAAWPLFGQCTTQGTKVVFMGFSAPARDVFRGSGVEILKGHAFGGWMTAFRLLESAGGGEFKEREGKVDNYESCRFPHYANGLLEGGDFREIYRTDEIGVFATPPNPIYIKPGNSYRFECIYDTTAATEEVTGGSDTDSANCQYQFYYREIPGENEPFPGFCMDMGPWFMRSPNLPQKKVAKEFVKWRINPIKQAMDKMMNKCPADNAKFAEDA